MKKGLRVLSLIAFVSLLFTNVGCGFGHVDGFLPIDKDMASDSEKFGLGLTVEDVEQVNLALHKSYETIDEVTELVVDEIPEDKLKGLKGIFGALFGKLSGAFKGIREKIIEAREKLDVIAGRLDANNPAHQGILAQLDRAYDRLDQLDEKIAAAKQKVADKVQIVLDKIDSIRSRFNYMNPIYWVLDLVVTAVYEAIDNNLQKFLAEA